MGTSLHFVDCFDEVEESISTLSFIFEFTSSLICWFENSVIFEFFENVFVDIELLRFINIDFADEWSEVAKSSFFDFGGID